MRRWSSPGNLAAFVLASSVVFGFAGGEAAAQQYSADKPLGATAQAAPSYLKNAGISQNLSQKLPLGDRFRDSEGNDVTLGAYFHDRPVVLALVYYKCRLLCPQVLNGMANSLRQIGFKAGKEYDIVVASIDPTDSPADAAADKQRFLGWLNDTGAASSAHFLTGPQASITDLARATGFHYVQVPGPDGKMDQYAHSSVIMIATPDGRVSKYLFGIDYQPRDLRLSLIEASNHHIGTASDLVLLYCCGYSPSAGKYTVSVLRVMGLAGMGSVFMLCVMLYLLSRKPKGAASPA
jgi:protein SCO1